MKEFWFALRIKDMALWSSPYVCTGSHTHAMFAHKKIMGVQGTLTTLYRTLCILLFGMPACIVWLYSASSSTMWWFPDNFFFCLVCSWRESETDAVYYHMSQVTEELSMHIILFGTTLHNKRKKRSWSYRYLTDSLFVSYWLDFT
jgi:hypothetical protein